LIVQCLSARLLACAYSIS